jgi:DNA-directed RNA polymerase subunit RPC12/RpoP
MSRGLLRGLRRLRSLFSVSSDDEEDAYRCIRCGASFGRHYRTCGECGGEFVVPTDGDEGTNSAAGRSGP